MTAAVLSIGFSLLVFSGWFMAKQVPARMPGRLGADAATEPVERGKSDSPEPSGTDPIVFECARAFPQSRQPVLIVDCAREIIVHANAAAARLLGARRSALIGLPLRKCLVESSDCNIAAMLRRVRPTGSACIPGLRAVTGGKVIDAAASLVRSAGQDFLLLRPRLAEASAGASPAETFSIEDLDGASMGLVVTDAELTVLYSSRTFGRQVGLADGEQAVGRPLFRWLRLTERDLARLREQMASRQAVISVATRLVTEAGSARLVQILAIAVPDGPGSRWGFVLTGRASIN